MARFSEIADEIEGRIQKGRYRPGEKIPSIRKLAAEFSCAKPTVQRAFSRLKTDGLIENKVGSGSYVRFPERIGRTGEVYDFSTDYLSESFFPVDRMRTIFDRLFSGQGAGAIAAPPVAGDPELIRHLGRYYRLPTDRMLVLSGAQQGLDLAAKVFAARISEAALFEDPTYPGAVTLFRAKHFVPMEEDGPKLSALRRMLKDGIRLFYVMPSVHNPTGVSYSREKKEAVVDLVKRFGVILIEDDYQSEFVSSAAPRFVDLLPGQTLYIKSLAQATASGLRIGFMVVPESLFEKFRYAKYSADVVSAGLLQKFFSAFIRDGAYGEHLSTVRSRIARRKKRLLTLLSRYRELSIPGAQSGCSLWVECKRPLKIQSPPWTTGDHFSFSPSFRHCFRISFMNLDDDRFAEGLNYLRSVLDRALC
ncbi:MAG: PLP-dependent aminotransferase family protein [Desulfobacterales bacterium]|nr:PLP-dependent aminotransferase family protein [Desulfobacterales bacterium]